MPPARLLVAVLLTIAPCGFAAAEIEGIRVAEKGTGFVYETSGQPFVPWGLNYDHDARGRLLEDYWEQEWPKVEEDFRAMKRLGANVVRIHLQVSRFLDSAEKLNAASLARLGRLVALADQSAKLAHGWIGFYWGQTAEQYRKSAKLQDALVADWLEWFQRHGPLVGVPPLGGQAGVRPRHVPMVGGSVQDRLKPGLQPRAFTLGADISWVQGQEDEGLHFSDRGQTKDIFSLLKDRGFNAVRLRIFNNPRAKGGYSAKGYCDLDHTLRMARRIAGRRCSSCWTFTTATPGPIPATRSSRPLGPTCMALPWRRRSTITPATCSRR